MGICDQVTVLRDGSVALSVADPRTTVHAIIERMLGRSLERALSYRPRAVGRTGAPLLRVQACATAATGRPRSSSTGVRSSASRDCSAVGGRELMRAHLRHRPHRERRRGGVGPPVRYQGTPRRPRAPASRSSPRTGRAQGSCVEHSVGRNALMAAWRRFARAASSVTAPRARGHRTRRAARRAHHQHRPAGAATSRAATSRRSSSPGTYVDPSVLLLDDPTVGVDVGSKREILRKHGALPSRATAIVLVSSEFEELPASRTGCWSSGRRRRAEPRSLRRRRPLRVGIPNAVQEAAVRPEEPATEDPSVGQQEEPHTG